MKKIVWCVLVVITEIILLAGCGKSDTGSKGRGDSVKGDPNVITWVYQFYPELSEENQKEINRILREKGVEYEIQFIVPRDDKGVPIVGKDYLEWIREYEEKNGPLDIITSNLWSLGGGEVSFVKNRMIPLNSYLEAEDGKCLKAAYNEDEWKQCSIEGKVYVIPMPVNLLSMPPVLDSAVYITVNDSYSEYFESFDGTYASLRAIYKTIDNNNLHIIFPGIPPETRVLCGLMGLSCLGEGPLPIQGVENGVVDIIKNGSLRSLVAALYDDFKSGGLIIGDWFTEVQQERILAYIHMGKEFPREGFVDYVLAPDIYSMNLRSKYGINVDSDKKEQAFRVLALCYSDIDLLCLLCQGVDKELILKRKELLGSNPGSKWAGIHVKLDEKQIESLDSFDRAVRSLIADMKSLKDYDETGRAIYEINPEYDLNEEWKKFIEETGDFSTLCESVNGQIREWPQQ